MKTFKTEKLIAVEPFIPFENCHQKDSIEKRRGGRGKGENRKGKKGATIAIEFWLLWVKIGWIQEVLLD